MSSFLIHFAFAHLTRSSVSLLTGLPLVFSVEMVLLKLGWVCMGDMTSNGVTTVTLCTTNNSIPRKVFAQDFKFTFTYYYNLLIIYFFKVLRSLPKIVFVF